METHPYRGVSMSPGDRDMAPLPVLSALAAWAVLVRGEDGTARLTITPMPKGRQPTPAGDISCPLLGSIPEHGNLARATREQFHAWALLPGWQDRQQALEEFAKVREAAAWARAELEATKPQRERQEASPPERQEAPPAPPPLCPMPNDASGRLRASERRNAQLSATIGA